MEEPIFCFQHCDKSTNILCFAVPELCPLCQQDTEVTESRIPPYRVPSPLVDAKESPYSVVIRPTEGSILSDYTSSHDLHIGITDSEGRVYDYDEAGIHVGSPLWTECIAIPIVENLTPDSKLDWDAALVIFSRQESWTSVRYNEQDHNCLDFAFDFLRNRDLEKCTPSFESKSAFCTDVIVPRTSKAAKYISIHRQIVEHGYVCQAT